MTLLLFRKGLFWLLRNKGIYKYILSCVIIGLSWDYSALHIFNMWSWNGDYLIKFLGIPIIEETIFCIVIPLIIVSVTVQRLRIA